MKKSYTLVDNLLEERYEFSVEGHTAFVEYSREPGVIILTHTYVPRSLEGRGVASALTYAVLEEVRRRGLQVNPQCSFTRTYIERHPEWADLLVASSRR